MKDSEKTCPMDKSAAVDRYFLEHRAKLLDVAAFLDRLDRAAEGAKDADDFRMAAFHRALAMLTDGKGQRARRLLEIFSDDSTEPIESAAGLKGAHGACPLK